VSEREKETRIDKQSDSRRQINWKILTLRIPNNPSIADPPSAILIEYGNFNVRSFFLWSACLSNSNRIFLKPKNFIFCTNFTAFLNFSMMNREVEASLLLPEQLFLCTGCCVLRSSTCSARNFARFCNRVLLSL
jgi:hypothetical protein